jgi:hypothetical protein
MRSKKMVSGQVVLGLVALLPAANGCGPRFTARAEQPSAEARIQKIASLCSRYGAKHRRKPGSIEELKAWTKSLDKTELAKMGIEDADLAFVSPRDNQPFVLVKSPGSGPGDVLAYEKVGEGGKHYIVTPMGSAFELDGPELKRRVPSAK